MNGWRAVLVSALFPICSSCISFLTHFALFPICAQLVHSADRRSSSTSSERPDQEKTRERNISCERLYWSFSCLLLFSIWPSHSSVLRRLSSEAHRDAELGGGSWSRSLEQKAGGGQTNGGAQEVSFTQTQRKAVNEEIQELEANYSIFFK